MAFEWMKSVITGSTRQNSYLERQDSISIVDTIMLELDCQMKDSDSFYAEREREERRRSQKVDYSWLVSGPPRQSHRLPQVERLQLEELCSQVLADESSRVITSFRQLIHRDEPPLAEEMPELLRCVVSTVLQGRAPQDKETISGWVARRTTSLTSLGTRFLPVAHVRVEPLVNSSSVTSTTDNDNENPQVPDMFLSGEDLV